MDKVRPPAQKTKHKGYLGQLDILWNMVFGCSGRLPVGQFWFWYIEKTT